MNRKVYFVVAVFMMIVILFVAISLASASGVVAQGPTNPTGPTGTNLPALTVFTYQGQLKNGGNPVNGNCDFQFSLFALQQSPIAMYVQVGTTLTKTNVAVTNGLFNVSLDFGGGTGIFSGEERFLGISVRCPSGSGSYASLGTQMLSAAPYALSLVPGAVISGTGNALVAYGSSDTYATIYGGDISPSGGYGLYGDSKQGTGVGGKSIAGFGVRGISTYDTGVNGSSTYGVGVFGGSYSNTVSADAAGVRGKNIGNGYGVYGEGGIGVYGTGDTYGVQGESTDIGVVGNGTTGLLGFSTTGAAVKAQSLSGNLIEAWAFVGPNLRFYVSNAGNVYADGTYSSPAADMAEMLSATDKLAPGDVLVVGPDGKLTRSTQTYQTSVVGVYSTKPSFVGGVAEGQSSVGKVPLAIVGVVPVKVSAENGPIHPGDSLTTSSIPGHAMKATPLTLNGITFYPSGVILGKALGTLDKGTGVIQMLVTLQ